uniref:Uncharacterized protein n=1 Tax=Oryza barthii TaxID=65489 RepID=A0A0D3FAK2_9ORYZ
MAAAIDMYKYNTSTHQIASSDQELMKALEPFIRSASSSSASSPCHHYYSSSPSMSQDSYMPTPSYPTSSITTAATTTTSSFSQLPPLYSSQYHAASPAASATNGPMGLTHLGPAQIQQIQAHRSGGAHLAGPLHASVDAKLTAICQSLATSSSKNTPAESAASAAEPESPKCSASTEGEDSVSAGSPPPPTPLSPPAPWDESETFHLRKYPSWEIDWDSILS